MPTQPKSLEEKLNTCNVLQTHTGKDTDITMEELRKLLPEGLELLEEEGVTMEDDPELSQLVSIVTTTREPLMTILDLIPPTGIARIIEAHPSSDIPLVRDQILEQLRSAYEAGKVKFSQTSTPPSER